MEVIRKSSIGKTHRREFHSSIPVRSSNEETLKKIQEKLENRIKEVHDLQKKPNPNEIERKKINSVINEINDIENQIEQLNLMSFSGIQFDELQDLINTLMTEVPTLIVQIVMGI